MFSEMRVPYRHGEQRLDATHTGTTVRRVLIALSGLAVGFVGCVEEPGVQGDAPTLPSDGSFTGDEVGSSCESASGEAYENYRKLASCDVERPCAEDAVIYSSSALFGFRCLFSALRDRTTGTYAVSTPILDHPLSCAPGESVLLVVNGDGSVFVSRRYISLSRPSCCASYGATMRCKLESPDFFDDCLALGVEASVGGGAGAAGDDIRTPQPEECFPFYTDCEPAEPICPSE